MIKFTAGDKETGQLLGFGFSEKNIELLRTKGPILINLEDMGILNHHILIFYGKTEKEIANKVAGLMDEKVSLFVNKMVAVSFTALLLVLLQPLVIPFFGQILLDLGL